MPIKSLKSLSTKQRALWERIFKEQRAKGKSEALSAKVAWGVVKQASQETVHQKSNPIKGQIHEKSLDGNTYLEGYIFTFDVDEDNEAISKEFGNLIAKQISNGGLYHEDEENDLLKIVRYNMDNRGMFATVKVNKESSKYTLAHNLMREKPEELAFSVRFGSTQFGKRMVSEKGKYHSEIFEGRGIDFCITDGAKGLGTKAIPL